MNEDTKEYTLDDLEEIIREYSTRPPKKAADPAQDQTRRMDAATARVSTAAGDTRPLESPAAQADTTRPLPDPDGDVRIYHSPGTKKPTAEPFTAAWEPEYESPMGQYREPIEFPEKMSAARHARQQAQRIEQDYQALHSKSLGQLRAGMFLNAMLFAVAGGTALLYTQVGGSRLKLMIFGQLLVLLLSALVGCKRLVDGVVQLLHRRFRLNSLLVVTLAVCWIDGLCCLKSQRLPFAAVFSLQMLLAQWAEYQRLQVRLSQLDTLRKASQLYGVVKQPDYYKRLCAYREGSASLDDFLENCDAISAPEQLLCRYALAVTLLGALTAVTAAILHGPADGVRVYAAALLAALPATAFVCIQRPAAVLEKRMHKLGSVICGWKGVQQVEAQGYYPLEHQDLFPDSYVKLNGVRFYGERNPNTVVSYVAALMKADGGSLAGPFEQLRSSRNARICKVEELTSYPGGVGGQLDGLSVIAGTLEFIENMGVELSEVSRIPHAVYAAVNQSLCAVFAVNFTRSKSSASGLRTLCESHFIRPILVDCDFAMTAEFLEEKLGVAAGRMQFPDVMTRTTLSQKQPPEQSGVIALTTHRGLAQRAFALTGAAALGSAWRLGVGVHLLGGGIGFLAVALLALKGAVALLTPYNLLLYGCVWMIPGLLMSEWTRNI